MSATRTIRFVIVHEASGIEWNREECEVEVRESNTDAIVEIGEAVAEVLPEWCLGIGSVVRILMLPEPEEKT